MHSLTLISAAEMAERIARRQISPVELLEAHLRRIEELQPRLNAFVQIDEAGARAQARTAEQALMSGQPLGPLHGVPLTIKSSIEVAGLRCEAGSRLRAGFVASSDAPLVARLRSAGAIILGTTNVPEMLMAYETDNLLYGRTNNPWDLTRTAGGSSGGEAAAIATGCSAAGVGSDGGGSIRVPAHFTGICGLKPTPGRIPATGHFPESAGPFALLGVVGPMARSVGDLKLMFDAMSGPDDGDTCSIPKLSSECPLDARKLSIGVFDEDGLGSVTPETRAAVRRAASALQEQGFVITEFRPGGLEQIHRLWWVFFGLTGRKIIAPLFDGRERDMSPVVQKYLSAGSINELTLDLFMNTWFARDAQRIRLLQQMRDFPVLLCPVAAGPAFPHRAGCWRPQSGGVNYLEEMRFSQWFNLTGNPAVNVPVGRSPEGLPIGVQVVGRPYEEQTVLMVAAAIERAVGDRQAPPLARGAAAS